MASTAPSVSLAFSLSITIVSIRKAPLKWVSVRSAARAIAVAFRRAEGNGYHLTAIMLGQLLMCYQDGAFDDKFHFQK